VLKEIRSGITNEEVQRLTEPRLIIEGEPKAMDF
jgi:hypothetical protein